MLAEQRHAVKDYIQPGHLHAIWTLPSGDADFSGRWKRIKAYFTHWLVAAGVPIKRHRNGDYALWQRRFWEHKGGLAPKARNPPACRQLEVAVVGYGARAITQFA